MISDIYSSIHKNYDWVSVLTWFTVVTLSSRKDGLEQAM